jgi:hypothetical protein
MSSGDNAWDPNAAFETVLNGTWAPYAMTAWSGQSFVGDPGPSFSVNTKMTDKFSRIASVDIVLTSDKSKWTRSPVLEMGAYPELNEGGARRFTMRQAPSVDKDGNSASAMDLEPSENPNDPHYIGSYGMGWFPGYAINVETGERLNIMFGENSFLSAHNGRDMLFNPTARDLSLPNQFFDPNILSQIDGSPIFGGMHFVYVMSHDISPANQPPGTIPAYSPAYDAGRYAHEYLQYLRNTYISCIWKYFL